MKIINLSNTTFKAKPIYPINLKSIYEKGNEATVSGFFSEISNQNVEDLSLVRDIKNFWKTPPRRDNYINTICGHFINSKNKEYSNCFYITELANPRLSQYDSTKSIIETTNPYLTDKYYFYIDYIQSASQNTYQPFPKTKGAGALAIYGAVKLAKDNDFDNVKIFSLNNDFYDAIGLTPTDEACEVAAYYELPANKYDTFLKNIEEKYDIKKA